MTTKQLEVFDKTLQKTNAWLGSIADELKTDDRHHAYQALRATLHALRDRMSPADAAHLGAQLPILVRGIYYEGWRPTAKPLPIRRAEAFLELVRSELCGFQVSDTKRVIEAVFRVLDRHVSEGEIEHVKCALPAKVRRLWPDSNSE